MVDVVTLGTFVLAALASAFMAWTIGAGSSGSTPFAPAVGANAISVMRAGLVVGICCLLGAIFQGANVSEAVGGELIVGETLTADGATIGLSIAAALVAVGVFTGYPIATAFTVTGAVIGVGLAMGGDPAWPKYREIAALWLLTPFVGGGTAYLTARALLEEPIPERRIVLVLAGIVGALIANVEFAVLGPPDGGASISATVAADLPIAETAGAAGTTATLAAVCVSVLWADMRRGTVAAERHFLLALGALVAFSAGGSQVGLAVGPLVPLAGDVGLSLTALLVGGGVGLLVGAWTGATRMIKALSQDYSSLGPRRSIAALIPSFGIAQVAILYGIPVSFNQIVVSAIIGSGYAVGTSGVSGRKMGLTVLAWLLSLSGAFLLSYGGYLAFRGLVG